MMVTFRRNVMQHGDALELLQSLSESCSPLGFFDPQHRSNVDKLKYGNEGKRQKERCLLPQMGDDLIDNCIYEFARVLRPSGYLGLWSDTFRLGEAYHLRFKKVLPLVEIISWDDLNHNGCGGNGYRARRRGGYLLMLQKPPKRARATWVDHKIPDRWVETVDRTLHPHIKPICLIRRIIAATTKPRDLVIDPAAGSFVVMHAALELGRQFVGCDIAVGNEPKNAGDDAIARSQSERRRRPREPEAAL